MKIDFVKTLTASGPYVPGTIYFEETTSLIKVATETNKYRVFGGVRSAEYDSSTNTLTIQNGNGEEIYIDFSQYVNINDFNDRLDDLTEQIPQRFVVDVTTPRHYEMGIEDVSLNHYYTDIVTEYDKGNTVEVNDNGLILPLISILRNQNLAEFGTTVNQLSVLLEVHDSSAERIQSRIQMDQIISDLSLSIDSSTYVITLSGTKADGTSFTVSDPIDLPLESVVVNGSYNSSTKKVVLTLKSGSTVEFSVADLISGLQSEITSSNKLSADLIQDGTTNKVVSATDKNKWNNLVSNVQADWNATTGLAAILNKPTIPSTLDDILDGSTRKLSNYLPLSGGTMNVDASINIPGIAGRNEITNNYISIKGNDAGTVSTSLGANYLVIYDDEPVALLYANSLTFSASDADSDDFIGTQYRNGEIVKKISDTTSYSLAFPNKSGTFALTSDIPTDASVSDWGYIKTVTDASIAALGYTKNTGTLTGVKFNNVAATINGTVAEITATIPAAITESTVSGWGFTKNAGTITGITMNGTSKGTNGNVDLGTVITAETQPDWTVTDTSSAAYIKNKPTIPAAVTESTVSGWGFTKNAAANDATITIQKNGTTVDSFTVDASSNKTINMQVNELPAVTASDNGKILKVVNGVWTAVSPITVYSGSNTPNNSTGINGDIYIQS